MTVSNQTEFQVSGDKTKWEPPKQVVKRITKRIKPDGTETIEVRFIVSEMEEQRVQNTTSKTSNSNQATTRRKNPTQTTNHNDEELFEPDMTESSNIRISIGAMKRKVSGINNQSTPPYFMILSVNLICAVG